MKNRESEVVFKSAPQPVLPQPSKVTIAGAGTRVGTHIDSPIVGREPEVNSRRIEYLQEQMRDNSRRDLHLWTIALVVLVVLAAGLAGILAPGMMWKTMTLHLDMKYLPQLFWAMILLVALFSIYVTTQKREVSAARTALVQELIISEQLQAFSLLDSVTQLLNSCAIDNLAHREIVRANRMGSPLTFAAISLDNWLNLQKRLSADACDQALFQAARLLKSTFRGSDAIFRSGNAEFLVLMPDTSEQQAQGALSRLKVNTEQWNADTDAGLELTFSYGLSLYVAGGHSAESIERARRCMFLSSQKVNLVF